MIGAMAQRPNLPAGLLVPYVAAGAEELVDDGKLSERSSWAITDARAQLDRQRRALAHEAYDSEPAGSTASLMASAYSESLEFSALVLERTLQTPITDSPREHEVQASAALAALISDLDGLLAGDIDAARRTRATFEPIVDELATR